MKSKTSFLLICLSLLLLASCADKPLSEGATFGTSLEPTVDNLFEDASVELSQQVSVDPKTSTIIDDPNAKDGKAAALYRTGDGVRFELTNIQSGTYKVSVRARGDQYQGPPVMRLKLDGQQLGQDSAVKTGSYKAQGFGEVTLEQGQVLEAVFINDKWGGTPETDRNLYIDHLTLTPTGSPAPTVDGYDQNLQKIRAASVRNRTEDDSKFRNTPMNDIPITELYGPRSEYLGLIGGNVEKHFPVKEGGQFRVSCEFSHFAYDDPLVHPGKPGAAHLHMFWGNTDVNAYSTFDTLFNSGGSTCNGQELNRTGYWAPAVFDAQGNVRVPERIIVYYKGYGLANGRSQVYPEGAAMIPDRNVHEVSWNEGGTAGPGSGEFSFLCSDQFRGARRPASNTIPNCDGSRYFKEYGVTDNPHVVLEMHVKFPNCWNGQDPSNPDNWQLPTRGGWFYSDCQGWATFPNIEYIIAYPLEVGETTQGWYLASDVDPSTRKLAKTPGSSVHADWWGGWNPEVNKTWIDNCVNFKTDKPSGCGMGYLSDGGPDNDNPYPGPALKFRQQFEGPIKVPAATLYQELCGAGATPKSATGAAYCKPGSGL